MIRNKKILNFKKEMKVRKNGEKKNKTINISIFGEINKTQLKKITIYQSW